MYLSVRRRFTYANVVTTVALLFVMSGGAYAAGKYLITSTKQISPKVLKALDGKTGSVGRAGPAGPVGLQGPKGDPGSAGKDGTNGAPGKDGLNGAAGPAGGNGATGPAGANGVTGPAGAKGATGPAGSQGATGPTGPQGPLQSGKTETGSWSYSTTAAGPLVVSISFPLSLGAALDEAHVHYTNVATTECPGSAEKPEATAGNLCVYEVAAFSVQAEDGQAKVAIFPDGGEPPAFGGASGAGTSGAGLLFIAEEKGVGWGSWAVTEK